MLLLALPAGQVLAHEYWLSPSRYDAPPRQAIGVAALAGTGFRGEWKPWSPARAVRFVARTDHSVDLSRAARPGEAPWLEFATTDGRGAMLAFESDFLPIELPAEQFDAYLADEGLRAPLAARRTSGSRTPGRERYRRCAKAWLVGSDEARATTPIGLPLEIVPRQSPGSGSTLCVRVLSKGQPLAGARLRGWRSALGSAGEPRDPAARDSMAVAVQLLTNERGEALVPCAEQGEWMLSVVAMEPSRDRAAADWESTWSSLTFMRRPALRARR